MTRIIGYFGVVSRDDRSHAAYAVEEDGELRRMADVIIANTRMALADPDAGVTDDRERVVVAAPGVAEEDQRTLGALCTTAVTGLHMRHEALTKGVGLAIMDLTGRRSFVVVGWRDGRGTMTEIETMEGVEDAASARAYMANHPAVMGMAMADAFMDLLKGPVRR